MRHRPALALVLSAAVLAGCSGARDLERDPIPMVPLVDRVEGGREGLLPRGDRDRADDRGADRDGGAAADAVAGCGDPDGAAVVELAAGGAELQVLVPADADEDVLEDLEDYRADSGADPVCWVVVRVDNTGGDEVVDLPRVEVVAADGRRVQLQRAGEAVAAWSDLRPDDEDAAVRAVELVAEQDGVVGPGEEGEVVLVATTDLDDPRAVLVQPTDGAELVRADA